MIEGCPRIEYNKPIGGQSSTSQLGRARSSSQVLSTMSPDIEWHIGEEDERETVAQTTAREPARWRKVMMLVVVSLGIGLGVWYKSIPTPPPPPTPTLLPTETPLPPAPPLESFIAREAQALSSGDRQTYLSLLDPTDFQWRQEQLGSYQAWGAPPGSDLFYTIIATGTLGNTQAWADVIQYRDGQYFRELRFYRRAENGWLRRSPVLDESAWGRQQTTVTPYFDITYYEREADYAFFLRDQFASKYEQECQKFGCDLSGALPTLHLVLQPDASQQFSRNFRGGQGLTLTLPSPSLTGLYYASLENGEPGQNDQIDREFDRYLFFPILSAAAGGFARGRQNQGAGLYIFAIGAWELAQEGSSEPLPRFGSFGRPDVLTDTTHFIPLADMWQSPFSASPQERVQLRAQANELIKFIGDTYGADTVYQFFHALRDAQSLPQAIESVGLPYDAFELKWQAWLKHLNPPG